MNGTPPHQSLLNYAIYKTKINNFFICFCILIIQANVVGW